MAAENNRLTVAFEELCSKVLPAASIANKCGHFQEVIIRDSNVFRIAHYINYLEFNS